MSSLWEDLLPGIQHDFTLTHIVTKLPWTAFHVLSSVSKTWQRTIKSGEIYRERIRSHSREELLAVKHYSEVKCDDVLHRNCTYRNAISLYSMKERGFYRLPPIPHLCGGSESLCQLIASNGKLYVCSHKHMKSTEKLSSNGQRQISGEKMQVYALDLAGQWLWEECGDIQEPEQADTCCRINCLQKAGGKPEHAFLTQGRTDWCPDVFSSLLSVVESWRLGEPSEVFAFEEVPEMSFTGDPGRASGEQKQYLMTSPARGYPNIYVQDTKTRLWKHQHLVSCDEISREFAPELGEGYPLKVETTFAVLVNNEVFAIVRWGRCGNHGYEILQSRGFGTNSKEIAWERISRSFPVEPSIVFGMCPITL